MRATQLAVVHGLGNFIVDSFTPASGTSGQALKLVHRQGARDAGKGARTGAVAKRALHGASQSNYRAGLSLSYRAAPLAG